MSTNDKCSNPIRLRHASCTVDLVYKGLVGAAESRLHENAPRWRRTERSHLIRIEFISPPITVTATGAELRNRERSEVTIGDAAGQTVTACLFREKPLRGLLMGSPPVLAHDLWDGYENRDLA